MRVNFGVFFRKVTKTYLGKVKLFAKSFESDFSAAQKGLDNKNKRTNHAFLWLMSYAKALKVILEAHFPAFKNVKNILKL